MGIGMMDQPRKIHIAFSSSPDNTWSGLKAARRKEVASLRQRVTQELLVTPQRRLILTQLEMHVCSSVINPMLDPRRNRLEQVLTDSHAHQHCGTAAAG